MSKFVENLGNAIGIHDLDIDTARRMCINTGKRPFELAKQLAIEGLPKYTLEALHLVPTLSGKVHKEIMAIAFDRWVLYQEAYLQNVGDLIDDSRRQEILDKIGVAKGKAAVLRDPKYTKTV